jgi:hypothetical protein
MKLIGLIFLFFSNEIFCENILFLNGITSPSHHYWNSQIARGLALKGHNVTFLSVDKSKSERNIHFIHIEGVYEVLFNEEKFDLLAMAIKSKENKIQSIFASAKFHFKACEAILNSANGLNKILSYPENFEFNVIVNDFSAIPCLTPLAHKFKNASLIGTSPFLNPPNTVDVIGGHKYPSYVPHYRTDFPQIMTFYQRFQNHVLYWVERL